MFWCSVFISRVFHYLVTCSRALGNAVHRLYICRLSLCGPRSENFGGIVASIVLQSFTARAVTAAFPNPFDMKSMSRPPITPSLAVEGFCRPSRYRLHYVGLHCWPQKIIVHLHHLALAANLAWLSQQSSGALLHECHQVSQAVRGACTPGSLPDQLQHQFLSVPGPPPCSPRPPAVVLDRQPPVVLGRAPSMPRPPTRSSLPPSVVLGRPPPTVVVRPSVLIWLEPHPAENYGASRLRNL